MHQVTHLTAFLNDQIHNTYNDRIEVLATQEHITRESGERAMRIERSILRLHS
jgi:hypothetical protein